MSRSQTLEKQRNISELHALILKHGPMTVPQMVEISPLTDSCIRKYVQTLQDQGLITVQVAVEKGSHKARSVYVAVPTESLRRPDVIVRDPWIWALFEPVREAA